MAYDYDKTHESIMQSATKHFLKVGFPKSSIRQICMDAGVTNGAFYAHFDSKEDLFAKLVEPALTGLNDLRDSETSRYMEISSSKDVVEVMNQAFSSDEAIIHFIYEHAEAFRLLLNASSGTSFERFSEKIVEDEREGTAAFFELCKPFVKRPENMSDNIIAQASSFVVSTIFYCLLSGKPEEEALIETQRASEFCLAGMRQLWGI